jgi:hypothetical protein
MSAIRHRREGAVTAEIEPETMAALRPHLDAEELGDDELRAISEKTGVDLAALREARDALWQGGAARAREGDT